MPFNVRANSIKIAVFFFFITAIIGSFCGLSSLACCKRSVIVAIVAFFISSFAVKAVNAILINAIANSRVEQVNGNENDDEN